MQAAQHRLRQAEQIFKADKEAYDEAQEKAEAECPVNDSLKKKFEVGCVALVACAQVQVLVLVLCSMVVLWNSQQASQLIASR